MKKPKEDPEDKRARLRERRLSQIDRQAAGEQNAASLTSDIRAIYGTPKAPVGNKLALPFLKVSGQ